MGQRTPVPTSLAKFSLPLEKITCYGGTDSIWYGTPQWQIKAFRRFQIPDELQEILHYLTLTKILKAKVFGLNAAKLFKLNVEEKRHETYRKIT